MFDVFPEFPVVDVLKDHIPGLVENPLEDDGAHHDGEREGGRPLEEQVVDLPHQRHLVAD